MQQPCFGVLGQKIDFGEIARNVHVHKLLLFCRREKMFYIKGVSRNSGNFGGGGGTHKEWMNETFTQDAHFLVFLASQTFLNDAFISWYPNSFAAIAWGAALRLSTPPPLPPQSELFN